MAGIASWIFLIPWIGYVLVTAIAVGIGLGRIIRERDRQVPQPAELHVVADDEREAS